MLRYKLKVYSAFTLIELLVVIAIIGILTALAVVSLQNSRRSARDTKRLSDVKQIQIALELYYHDNNNYPETLVPGESLASNSITYMETIPYPPTTIDGDCSTTSYTYSTSNDQSYYNIHFCLSSNTGSLPAGEVVASPRGLGVWTCGERLLDERDNQSYATVQIGNQCWMAENLNIGTRIDGDKNQENNYSIEKYCFLNNEDNCDIYGGMYQWWELMNYTTSTLRGICPNDWYVPENNQIIILRSYVYNNTNYFCNGSGNSKPIASQSYWAINTTTPCTIGYNIELNNNTGFSAVGAGYAIGGSGTYGGLKTGTYFWTSTSIDANFSRIMDLYSYIIGISNNTANKSWGLSVRCIKD
jgi:uncharacterized protein (TIGR02145 family)/prepilin-type N-terminal cleavage/methylation domain-containing protein